MTTIAYDPTRAERFAFELALSCQRDAAVLARQAAQGFCFFCNTLHHVDGECPCSCHTPEGQEILAKLRLVEAFPDLHQESDIEMARR